MTKLTKLFFATIILQLQACSFLFPYEDEFACNKPDNLGKCVSATEAYAEITTGVSAGPKIIPASEQDDKQPTKNVDSNTVNQSLQLNDKPSTGYDTYVDANYKKVAGLLNQNVTPIVKPVVTAEILIMPYSDKKNILKGERFITVILEEPSFVLGDYLKQKTSSLPSIFKELKQ